MGLEVSASAAVSTAIFTVGVVRLPDKEAPRSLAGEEGAFGNSGTLLGSLTSSSRYLKSSSSLALRLSQSAAERGWAGVGVGFVADEGVEGLGFLSGAGTLTSSVENLERLNWKLQVGVL